MNLANLINRLVCMVIYSSHRVKVGGGGGGAGVSALSRLFLIGSF